jgi:glycosyltransferase involved in cell wall biosynthesis
MKRSSPAVSVVVPLFNKAPYVKRCVDSILGQTLRDFELIVVEDGSTDGGAAIVRAYDDSRMTVIAQANAGPGAARNRGVREARAEYVAFLDADDEWRPTYLERGVGRLDARPEAATVSCGYIEAPRKRSSEAIWRRRGIRDGLVAFTPESSPLFAVHILTCMSPWSTIARREIIERYGGFNASATRTYGEDNELFLKVLLNEAIAFYSEPLVIWHSEASELSRNTRGPRLTETFLLEPQGLYDACKPAMRELLRRILAVRAGKTACMLSYWGKRREARELVARYCTFADLRLPWVFWGSIGATSLGVQAGRAVRFLRHDAGGNSL